MNVFSYSLQRYEEKLNIKNEILKNCRSLGSASKRAVPLSKHTHWDRPFYMVYGRSVRNNTSTATGFATTVHVTVVDRLVTLRAPRLLTGCSSTHILAVDVVAFTLAD